MIHPWISEILPVQHTGRSSRTVSSLTLPGDAEAQDSFTGVRDRLLRVNDWHLYSGRATAQFQLTAADGSPVFRRAREDDYFQIDIPGPGSIAGRGRDWVRIRQIGDKHDAGHALSFFTVDVARAPGQDDGTAAHFFASAATSTFVVFRDHRRIIAAVYGRNEHANTDSSRWQDRLRNLAVALGAWLGLSHVQWKSLTKGLLEPA